MAWRDFFSRPLVRGSGAAAPGTPDRGAVGAPIRSAAAVVRAAPGRWAAAVVAAGLWWWAVVRLTFWPEGAGVVEGAVAAGGWGLSLLPVHCVPRTRRGGRRSGARAWSAHGGCVGFPVRTGRPLRSLRRGRPSGPAGLVPLERAKVLRRTGIGSEPVLPGRVTGAGRIAAAWRRRRG